MASRPSISITLILSGQSLDPEGSVCQISEACAAQPLVDNLQVRLDLDEPAAVHAKSDHRVLLARLEGVRAGRGCHVTHADAQADGDLARVVENLVVVRGLRQLDLWPESHKVPSVSISPASS